MKGLKIANSMLKMYGWLIMWTAFTRIGTDSCNLEKYTFNNNHDNYKVLIVNNSITTSITKYRW